MTPLPIRTQNLTLGEGSALMGDRLGILGAASMVSI